MEAQQAAERQKIAAQAEAEVAKTKADAEAYAVRAKAEAEAEANKKINESLTRDLIDYTQVQTWDGKLPTFVGGDSSIPIFNIETETTSTQE